MKQVLTKITACAFAALSGLCLVGGVVVLSDRR